MNEAIEQLYSVFSCYRLGDDFLGCDHCVSIGDSARLAAIPLRKLTFQDVEKYSRKAITTWGNEQHFKHFLPRLYELTIEHRDEFLDLAIVFGKLSCAVWNEWPRSERNAVQNFLAAYWKYQLAVKIETPDNESIDTVLCAISRAVPSVHPFLAIWTETESENALRHLSAFITLNGDYLLRKGKLWNSFWDASAKPQQEVLDWLQSKELNDFVGRVKDNCARDDFAYAWALLDGIRASLRAD